MTQCGQGFAQMVMDRLARAAPLTSQLGQGTAPLAVQSIIGANDPALEGGQAGDQRIQRGPNLPGLHFYDDVDLCHCCWFDHQAQALLDGRAFVQAPAIALLVQSNLNLSSDHEDAVLRSALAGEPALAGGQWS